MILIFFEHFEGSSTWQVVSVSVVPLLFHGSGSDYVVAHLTC